MAHGGSSADVISTEVIMILVLNLSVLRYRFCEEVLQTLYSPPMFL